MSTEKKKKPVPKFDVDAQDCGGIHYGTERICLEKENPFYRLQLSTPQPTPQEQAGEVELPPLIPEFIRSQLEQRTEQLKSALRERDEYKFIQNENYMLATRLGHELATAQRRIQELEEELTEKAS